MTVETATGARCALWDTRSSLLPQPDIMNHAASATEAPATPIVRSRSRRMAPFLQTVPVRDEHPLRQRHDSGAGTTHLTPDRAAMSCRCRQLPLRVGIPAPTLSKLRP